MQNPNALTSRKVITAEPRSIGRRLSAHWPFKTLVGGAILAGFYLGYFVLQRFQAFPVTQMPPTALDGLIGFHPETTLLYLSLWLYIPIAPWLADTRRELRIYSAVLGGMCLVGLILFFFWPTAISRPEVADGQPWAYRTMVSVDGLCNACPSLHAAFVVFCGYCNGRTVREMRWGRVLQITNWLWGAGILYATLATKQHVAIDILFGAVLGLAACFAQARLSSGTTTGADHE